MVLTWYQRFTGRRRAARAGFRSARRCLRQPLAIELLEDRCVPSTGVLDTDPPSALALPLLDHLTAVPALVMEDTSFTRTVAIFRISDATDVQATIAWGDGLMIAGVINPQTYDFYGVVGTHTYADSGTFGISVTVAQPDGITQTVTSAAAVLQFRTSATFLYTSSTAVTPGAGNLSIPSPTVSDSIIQVTQTDSGDFHFLYGSGTSLALWNLPTDGDSSRSNEAAGLGGGSSHYLQSDLNNPPQFGVEYVGPVRPPVVSTSTSARNVGTSTPGQSKPPPQSEAPSQVPWTRRPDATPTRIVVVQILQSNVTYHAAPPAQGQAAAVVVPNRPAVAHDSNGARAIHTSATVSIYTANGPDDAGVVQDGAGLVRDDEPGERGPSPVVVANAKPATALAIVAAFVGNDERVAELPEPAGYFARLQILQGSAPVLVGVLDAGASVAEPPTGAATMKAGLGLPEPAHQDRWLLKLAAAWLVFQSLCYGVGRRVARQ